MSQDPSDSASVVALHYESHIPHSGHSAYIDLNKTTAKLGILKAASNDRYKIYLAGGVLCDQSRKITTNLSDTHLFEKRIFKVRLSAHTTAVVK